MGCELSRQLKSPARGCGRSIAGAERLLFSQGPSICCWLWGVVQRVNNWRGVAESATCVPRVRSCFGPSLATPSQSSDLLLLLFLLFMHQLDHAAFFFIIVVKSMSHS